MVSNSTLTIRWLQPELQEERWEYFNHPAKQQWYQQHAAAWEQIESSFDSGLLVPYPRSGLIGEVPVALSYHSYPEYQTYLAKAKRGYRRNYSKMEESLQFNGTLTLKAPIILVSGGEALLFSGYRRLCLAWNYGIIPHVWLVSLGESFCEVSDA